MDQLQDDSHSETEATEARSKCVNCVNCQLGCQTPTDYSAVTTDQHSNDTSSCPTCVALNVIKSDNTDTEDVDDNSALLEDRFQNADAPNEDACATPELKEKLEQKLIEMDATNPLRATLYDHTDENNKVISTVLAWGAVETFSEEYMMERWTDEQRLENPEGLGVMRISHLTNLVHLYEQEQPQRRDGRAV